MTNLKKSLIVILIGILLLSIYSVAFASDDFGIIPDGNTAGSTTNNATTITNNSTNTANTTNNVLNPTNGLTGSTNNTNTSTYNNTNNLPKTGVEDYTIITAIVLLAIIAIYAYKKVRDYKNI